MNRVAIVLAITLGAALPAYAQTSIFLEDFSGGTADWADVAYSTSGVTFNGSGGHDGGAYVTADVDIDTSSNGAQGLGGYTAARCADSPSQNLSLNCSGGNFVGNWYFTDGVQQLTLWFRHNSTKPGGIIPQIRVATPGNTPGGSAIYPAVPANTWTQLTVNIDGASPEWDPSWGALVPDAVQVLRNVGRVQLGYFVEPSDPDYFENNVNFDIDDVEILGATSLTAEIVSKGVIHPHHDAYTFPSGSSVPDDDVRARVLGALTSAGDPADIVTNNILATTVRIGPLGGAAYSSQYGVNEDGDGIPDAEFRALMTKAVGDTRITIGGTEPPTNNRAGRCLNPPFDWQNPTIAVRAELTTGEIIVGEDTTVNVNCDAPCHN